MLKNANFISELMTKKDCKKAFEASIDQLIEQGYLKRYYQYFRPTEKLWELLIPNEVEIFDVQRINGYNYFHIRNIMEIFECDKRTAKVILQKYFVRTDFGYWKRSRRLDELLADGETRLKL